MRVLLLRASHDAVRSAEALQKRGHRLLVSPVIEIVPTGQSVPSGAFDAVIASSAQAFKYISRDEAVGLRDLPLLCVGSRTAAAALKSGFRAASIIADNAKSLAPQIVAKFAVPAHFLYLAGEDRKPDLEEQLFAAQFDLTLHETYRAEPAEKLTMAAVTAIEHEEIDAVLHYSRRSAEIFLDLAGKAKLDLSRPGHFCLSADVAVPLVERGLPHIRIADTPDETALLAKLTGFSLC